MKKLKVKITVHLFIFLNIFFISPLLYSQSSTSPKQKDESEIHWEQTGLEYEQRNSSELSTILYLLKIDPTHFALRPVWAKKFGEALVSIQDLAIKSEAIAMINANFFDPEGKPLGLIIEKGKILNPFHPTSWWAAFLQQDHQGRIQSRIEKIFSEKQLRSQETGLQAGPRLVAQGQALKLKENVSRKSLVGLDSQGKIYLLATSGPVSISKLADYLAKPKNKGGLELKEVLNLDGGSSTQFYLKMNQGEVWSPGWTSVPVGLGVFKK